MQERPNTIARCPIPHGKSSGRQYRVGDNLAGAVAPDWVRSASRTLLRLYGWRPFWLRGDFPGLRPRNFAPLAYFCSLPLEHSDFVCLCINERPPAVARRVLPLGTCPFWSFSLP